MKDIYYAHTAEDGRKQTVLEHLTGTAERCASFAKAFDAETQGYLAGLAHDLGKYSDAFQRRLLENGPRVDHSTAGAAECQDLFASLCIAGHHSGLPNLGTKTDSPDMPTLWGRMHRAKKHLLPNYSTWKTELSLPPATPPSRNFKQASDFDFFTRMLYSCLTDADFLDTEAFMSDGSIERGQEISMEALTERLDAFTKGWFPPQTLLNEQRCSILEQCRRSGDAPDCQQGLYTLTVPTGGGKTIASLAFALHHAKTQGLRRVIYVVPYTSIIEQTADIFRKILGAEYVLEHHSGVLYSNEEEATPASQKLARATENWDMPVIVTTAVQFFDSLYANRSSQCRKLHNIVGSVIVFDEAQMLPLPYLRPCVSAIAQLVTHYKVSAVLCTATQPALQGLFHKFAPQLDTRELCPAGRYQAELFRRVQFEKAGLLSWESIAERMRTQEQVLCIVNTKRSAKQLFSLLSTEEGCYHLSTSMVPAHRRQQLAEIRKRLLAGLPCRVVSTSLIEAGVDVDFPTVLREVAGLDSMLQAAGRCNREGKRKASDSTVTLFRSECRVPPLFERNADIGTAILDDFADIASPDAITAYFQMLLHLSGETALDAKNILSKIESLSFAEIAEKFHLIDTDTQTVYIPWKEGEALVERLHQGERSKALFRQASQYAVSLFPQQFQNLVNAGAVVPLGESGLWYLRNPSLYDDHHGLATDCDSGNALFY